MMLLMVLVTVALSAVALVHALWGLNVWVPIKDEEALARAVVGARNVTRMPGTIPCFLVVAALVFLLIALWMYLSFIIWCGAVALIGRGVLAYTKLWRKMTPEEPFATLDQRVYGPLCIALGVALIFINIGN